jgi:hypothetical protein
MSIIITPIIEYVFQLAYPFGMSIGTIIGELLQSLVRG